MEWLSGRQDLFEGTAGWVANELTYATDAQTLIYNVRTRRGMRSDRLRSVHTTRLDGFVSPMGWVRFARLTLTDGGELTSHDTSDGLREWRVVSKNPSNPTYTYIVSPSRKELLEVKAEAGKHVVRYKYSDWRPVGTGYHAPYRVDYSSVGSSGAPDFYKSFQVEFVELASTATPPPPVLPASAVIDDRLAGRSVDGEGRPVEQNRPGVAHEVQGRSRWLSTNNVLVGIGVVLLAGSAILFKMRKSPA